MNALRIASTETLSRKSNSHGRRIFFLDIENYVGKAILDDDDVVSARESISHQFRLRGGDLVVIGTSHSANFLNAAFAWDGPRYIMRRGHDGADLALLEAIEEYRLDTFDEVLLLSGDGIFVDKAAELVAKGACVTVVSRAEALSRRFVTAVPYMLAA